MTFLRLDFKKILGYQVLKKGWSIILTDLFDQAVESYISQPLYEI